MADDVKLIKRYLSGDEYAIEELVMKYQKKIYALTYRMTGNIEDSKDLTQKSFMQAFKNIRNFRQESSFYTWLYQITLNACRNYFRKKDSTTLELNESYPQHEKGALSEVINKEEKSLLRAALIKIPDRQKTTITLRVYEGLSVKETADVMKCSEGAVKAHYHHGMKKLREILKERVI
jgi:RNA polymerase sigma-70 factor (ECF subfamily)